MACGHAKFTGKVGVCMATSGPGAIHLLNGLYDAKLDHQPVVAIVGQTFVRANRWRLSAGGQAAAALQRRGFGVLRAGQRALDVRHLSIGRCGSPRPSARDVRDRAADVQDMDAVEQQPHKTHTVHSGVGFWPGRLIPQQSQLQQAADILNAGERVAMLVGQGALHATDEVIAVADALGAGVAKALLGKAAVPDDVPFCTGKHRPAGHKPSWEMMQAADTLLMVGSSFPYSDSCPKRARSKRSRSIYSGAC